MGQLTNYDKLIIEIWTNGAITPSRLSANLWIFWLKSSPVLGVIERKIGESEPAEEVEEDEETSEAETSIEELELSVRAYNCLKRAHIDTVQELVSILQERPEDLKKIKNLGQKTFEEIVEKVEKWSSEVESKEEKGVNKGEAPGGLKIRKDYCS